MTTIIHWRDETKTEIRKLSYVLGGSRWIARDSLYGVELISTNGRSKAGNGHQFYVFAPEWFISRYADYRFWRFGIRAFDSYEAIQRAHKDRRVEKLYTDMWWNQFNFEVAYG